VTVNNISNKHRKWRKVKIRVIERFGTIRAAAKELKCHPNAIRYSTEGKCPNVQRKLEEILG